MKDKSSGNLNVSDVRNKLINFLRKRTEKNLINFSGASPFVMKANLIEIIVIVEEQSV